MQCWCRVCTWCTVVVMRSRYTCSMYCTKYTTRGRAHRASLYACTALHCARARMYCTPGRPPPLHFKTLEFLATENCQIQVRSCTFFQNFYPQVFFCYTICKVVLFWIHFVMCVGSKRGDLLVELAGSLSLASDWFYYCCVIGRRHFSLSPLVNLSSVQFRWCPRRFSSRALQWLLSYVNRLISFLVFLFIL